MYGLWLVTEVEESLGQLVERTAAAPARYKVRSDHVAVQSTHY